MRFHIRLQAQRIKYDLTTKELADHLGVSVRLIQRYETGERKPNIVRLSEIADYFGVSTDYLLGRTDELDPYPRP